MELEDLVLNLTSATPNLVTLTKILQVSPEFIKGVVWENGSVLHLAARNDVLNGTNLVQWLVEKFGGKINFANEGGSVPVLWALAAVFEAKEFGKEFFLGGLEWMVRYAGVDFTKNLMYRGKLKKFIVEFYDCEEIRKVFKGIIEF